MRPSLYALVLAGLVLAPFGVASAQDKIAPTRTYGTDRNYGKDYGANYMTRAKQAPDRDFSMPNLGRKGAVMPEQKGPPKEANAPNAPLPDDAASPAPNAAQGGGAGVTEGFGLPDLAPNHEGIPPASPGTNTDFFAHTAEFDLPKPGTDADATDTPLYTTSNPTAAGGTAALGQDSLFGTDALTRDGNFGTQDGANADQPGGK